MCNQQGKGIRTEKTDQIDPGIAQAAPTVEQDHMPVHAQAEGREGKGIQSRGSNEQYEVGYMTSAGCA